MNIIKNTLRELLCKALGSSGEVQIRAIKEFQDIVWSDTFTQDQSINDMLTDTAYILDFYEPNIEWRKEDPSFYGGDRLEEVLVSALEHLEKLNKNF